MKTWVISLLLCAFAAEKGFGFTNNGLDMDDTDKPAPEDGGRPAPDMTGGGDFFGPQPAPDEAGNPSPNTDLQSPAPTSESFTWVKILSASQTCGRSGKIGENACFANPPSARCDSAGCQAKCSEVDGCKFAGSNGQGGCQLYSSCKDKRAVNSLLQTETYQKMAAGSDTKPVTAAPTTKLPSSSSGEFSTMYVNSQTTCTNVRGNIIDQPCSAAQNTVCDAETCKGHCEKDSNCNYVGLLSTGGCILYRNCDTKRNARFPGTTWKKLSSTCSCAPIASMSGENCDYWGGKRSTYTCEYLESTHKANCCGCKCESLPVVVHGRNLRSE